MSEMSGLVASPPDIACYTGTTLDMPVTIGPILNQMLLVVYNVFMSSLTLLVCLLVHRKQEEQKFW